MAENPWHGGQPASRSSSPFFNFNSRNISRPLTRHIFFRPNPHVFVICRIRFSSEAVDFDRTDNSKTSLPQTERQPSATREQINFESYFGIDNASSSQVKPKRICKCSVQALQIVSPPVDARVAKPNPCSCVPRNRFAGVGGASPLERGESADESCPIRLISRNRKKRIDD